MTTVHGKVLNDKQYQTLKSELGQKGIRIEDGANLLDMRTEFNGMSGDDKEDIAKSFDSLLDLKLSDDIQGVMKQYGIDKYTDLINNPKCKDKLKSMGIVVQGLDKHGKPVSNPKDGQCRDWVISRVDKDGKVIADEKGNLAQFKWKDYNSDGYAQCAEVNVNELLAAAGYDCVSRLKLNAADAASLKNIQGQASDVTVDMSGIDAASAPGKINYDMLNSLSQKLAGTDTTKQNTNIGGKEKISQTDFDTKVEDLMNEKGYSKDLATLEISSKYEVDYSKEYNFVS